MRPFVPHCRPLLDLLPCVIISLTRFPVRLCLQSMLPLVEQLFACHRSTLRDWSNLRPIRQRDTVATMVLNDCPELALESLPNRYSALCWRPVMHAQTWASYSALYWFGRLSKASSGQSFRTTVPTVSRCLIGRKLDQSRSALRWQAKSCSTNGSMETKPHQKSR